MKIALLVSLPEALTSALTLAGHEVFAAGSAPAERAQATVAITRGSLPTGEAVRAFRGEGRRHIGQY